MGHILLPKGHTNQIAFDKYFLFIERGFNLLNSNGVLGYIIPSKFAKVGAGKKLRGLLSDKKAVEKIISFGANQIFKDKTTYTCILILKKTDQNSLLYHEVEKLENWKAKNYTVNYDGVEFSSLNEETWILMPNQLKTLFYDIVYKNVKINYDGNEILSIFAAQYKEVLQEGAITLIPYISEVNISENIRGHVEYDGEFGLYSDNFGNFPVEDRIASFRIGQKRYLNGLLYK